MKVLFIGGTGIISSACSDLAIERGIDLYMLNRGQSVRPAHPQAHHLFGDIRQPDTLLELLSEHTFDVVVNWVAYIPEPIYLYQLSLRLPDAPRQAAGDRRNPARKSILGILAQ
jgi:nucleoside-diphosphate-sugar epimerase